MHKEIDDIRKEAGLSQEVFAGLLGETRKTYQNRLNGFKPYWTFDELTVAARFNDGEIIVNDSSGKRYEVTIKEIAEEK